MSTRQDEALGEAVRLICMTFVYLVPDVPIPERRGYLGSEIRAFINKWPELIEANEQRAGEQA